MRLRHWRALVLLRWGLLLPNNPAHECHRAWWSMHSTVTLTSPINLCLLWRSTTPSGWIIFLWTAWGWWASPFACGQGAGRVGTLILFSGCARCNEGANWNKEWCFPAIAIGRGNRSNNSMGQRKCNIRTNSWSIHLTQFQFPSAPTQIYDLQIVAWSYKQQEKIPHMSIFLYS